MKKRTVFQLVISVEVVTKNLKYHSKVQQLDYETSQEISYLSKSSNLYECKPFVKRLKILGNCIIHK